MILPGRGGREVLAPRRVREPNKRKVKPDESGAPVRDGEGRQRCAWWWWQVFTAAPRRSSPVGESGARPLALPRPLSVAASNAVDPGEIRGWQAPGRTRT